VFKVNEAAGPFDQAKDAVDAKTIVSTNPGK